MKSQFFMNMNDMILNKNDELKFLILMREEFFKYKLKIYYFRKWKSRALYNHDLLEYDDPFKNNDIENYQNFKTIQQRATINSNDNFGNNSINNNIQSRIGNNPNLLLFEDEEKNNKNNNIKLEDSIKVLDVNKDINNALSNTNDVFNRFNTINSNDSKNEQYNNILHSIERLKKNVTYGDSLKNNKLNDNEKINNNFKDLLIKKDNKDNNDINIIQNKKDLSSMRNQKKDRKKYSKKGEKDSKNLDIKNIGDDKSKSKSKSKKKFDIKKIYKYKAKDNFLDDEEKYKNSKYLSTKYRDYLHSGEKLYNTKKLSSKQKNKLNDLYQDIKNNLEKDEELLRRLELKRDISNQNIKKNKNPNQMNKSEDNINNIKNNIKTYCNKYDNTKNFEENLINNGFFSGKNKKNDNENIENDDNSEDTYPQKIKEIINKYQNIESNKDNDNFENKGKKEINSEKDKIRKIEKNIDYDYMKKYKASEQDQGIFMGNKYIPNYINNINYKRVENDIDEEYDKEYDEIFHPKNIRKTNINNYNQLNNSDYSNSIYNIINNLDGYENLGTDLNEPKYNRINKRRIIRHPKKERDERQSFAISNYLENSMSNNTSYILAPMKAVPITNISFRARMKYFSDKKQKNLEKLIKAKKDEEKKVYTFKPKTGENRLNVIKYDNYINTEINNNQRKPNYNRINDLYLDYKERKNKLDELTKEYYKKAGISFTPMINDKNKEMKEFKNKIGQIPYLDRIDIYNISKQKFQKDNNLNFIPTELY